MKSTVLFTLFLVTLCVIADPIYTGITLDNVDRTIDLSKPNMVRQSITLTATNSGSQTAQSIFFSLPRDFASKLSFFHVSSGSKKTDVISQVTDSTTNKDAVLYEYTLDSALKSGEKLSLTLALGFIGLVKPYPEYIKQKDNQKLLYKDNVYLFSPYAVKSQKTTVRLGGAAIESFSEIRPFDRRGGDLVFGSYSDQTAFANKELRVHFQTNYPFAVVTKAERTLEISHWGNLAVEEHYEIRHAGAQLKGPFSRLDYSKGPQHTAPSSFRSLVASLPIHAADIYYRDRIGNISTSTCQESSDKKNLNVEFLARYPLFGGWKTTFYFGYNLPIQDVLTIENGKYILRTPFAIPFDYPVEDLTVKVIIPEGASDIKVETRFPIDSESRDVLKTYLDVVGRTVLIIKKKNVLPEHNINFKTSYTFTTAGLLQEPLLVIGALFGFCLFVMAYVRFDLTIYKTEADIKQENATRIIEVVENYTDKVLERNQLYGVVERNMGNADKEIKNIRKSRQEIEDFVKTGVLAELEQLGGSSYAPKVGAIEKLDKDKFATLEQIINAHATIKDAKKLEQTVKQLEKDYDQYTEKIADAVEDLSQSIE
jgi:oligosaccharyltransferase complex subunit alpha (ribophorin I)